MAKANSESVIKDEEKTTELKFNKDKKYMISANQRDDNRGGFHYCNVGFKEYKVALGKPIEINESLFSYFTNAEIITVPGCDLKDESTYVDIEKDTYYSKVEKRFVVTEV